MSRRPQDLSRWSRREALLRAGQQWSRREALLRAGQQWSRREALLRAGQPCAVEGVARPGTRRLIPLVRLGTGGLLLAGCGHLGPTAMAPSPVPTAPSAPSAPTEPTEVAQREWRPSSADELAELRRREETMFPRRARGAGRD